MAAAERLCVGVVVGAHGTGGAVKIKSFTRRPGDLAAYGPLTDETGGRSYRVAIASGRGDVMVCRMDGVEDRDAAAALKGLRLYVSRSALPPTEGEEEYYHADLLGLAVETVAGEALGRVRAVHDFGAGDVIEVSGEAGGSVFVPFTRAVVPKVDLAAGRLVVDPPEGLLEPDTGTREGAKTRSGDGEKGG